MIYSEELNIKIKKPQTKPLVSTSYLKKLKVISGESFLSKEALVRLPASKIDFEGKRGRFSLFLKKEMLKRGRFRNFLRREEFTRGRL